MPRRSPSAWSSAWPSAIAASSAVWWSPVSRSPAPFEHEVEAGVKGELLEEVVVEPGPGLDPDARRSVEREPHREPRLGGRAQHACAAPALRRDRRRAVEDARQRLDERVVVHLVEHRDANRLRIGAHDHALAQQLVAERAPVGHRDVEEVGVRRQRLEAERAQARREPLALLDDRRDIGRRGERGERERGRQRRDRGRRLAVVQLGGDIRRRERVADARTREREDLRERPQHDHAVVEQRHRRHARVLEVRLVDDERPRLGQRVERAGRVVRPARERQDRRVVADLRPRQLRRDAIERVRRGRRDRDPVAGAGERAGAEQDQVVGARAEDDVLGLDAVVVGDRPAQLPVAARRVAAHAGERAGDRPGPRRRQRQRRRVLVEAQHLRRVDARERGDLVGRRSPACRPGTPARALSSPHRLGVRRHVLGGGERLDRRPDAASPASVRRCTVTGLRNVSRPSPPTARAQPPVGRTWLPPVA